MNHLAIDEGERAQFFNNFGSVFPIHSPCITLETLTGYAWGVHDVTVFERLRFKVGLRFKIFVLK